MKMDKIKEILKNKRVQIMAGTVAGVLVLTLAGTMLLHNKNVENINIAIEEDSKKDVDKEKKDAKEQLEELKKVDTSNLSEEDKKNIESKIADVEKNGGSSEEVTSNTLNSTSNITSNSPSESSSSSNNGTSSSSSSQGTVQQATTPQEQSSEPSYTPPVVEPVKPSPAPTPQPPVETPSYPGVGEVQQRLISYGQSLGLMYNSSLVTEGYQLGWTEQMWSSEMGNSVDGQRLFNGFIGESFAIVVTDLGSFCRMEVYASWDF